MIFPFFLWESWTLNWQWRLKLASFKDDKAQAVRVSTDNNGQWLMTETVSCHHFSH